MAFPLFHFSRELTLKFSADTSESNTAAKETINLSKPDILREDLKTKEAWVSALIDPINSFFDTVYIALNKNITFSENIRCMVKEVTVVTSATYPALDLIKFPNTLKVKASGLWVIFAIKKDDYTPVMSPVYASWVEDNGVITISGLSGLSVSTSYLIRFIII